MTIIPARLGLQQRVFPEYRAPFFNLLAKSCLEGFSLFTGLPRSEEAICTASALENANYQPGTNIHISSGKTYFCYQRGLLRWLEDWQPNVLVVEANPRYLSTPAAIRWMHKHHRPVIGWGLGAPSAGKTGVLLRKQFLDSLDAVIAYSQAGAHQFESFGINPQKIFVAANAVMPKPVHPPPLRAAQFQTGKASLLFVGRLQARKQVNTLLQACAALPPEIQPKLVVVGDGPERQRLESLAARVYPAAEFVGTKHGVELDPFFGKADLFVLPGTGGLAVQQAMAHALPVIVGQADGTQSNLVRPANGWCLPDSESTTLAGVIADALSNIKKLRLMGLASFQIVSEEVNLEFMVETFAKAIKSVL